MVEKGDDVTWKNGKAKAEGTVDEVHKENIEKTVQGMNVKRKGPADEQALVLEQNSGKKVVESAGEATRK